MRVRKLALLLTWGCTPWGAHADLYFDTNALDLSDEQKQQLNLQSFSDPETASTGDWDVEVLVTAWLPGSAPSPSMPAGKGSAPAIHRRCCLSWACAPNSFLSWPRCQPIRG